MLALSTAFPSEQATSPLGHFEVFPEELLLQFASLLPAAALNSLRATSKPFYRICSDERLWKPLAKKFHIYTEDFEEDVEMDYRYEVSIFDSFNAVQKNAFRFFKTLVGFTTPTKFANINIRIIETPLELLEIWEEKACITAGKRWDIEKKRYVRFVAFSILDRICTKNKKKLIYVESREKHKRLNRFKRDYLSRLFQNLPCGHWTINNGETNYKRWHGKSVSVLYPPNKNLIGKKASTEILNF